jgi:hypothetical protein
MLACDTPCIYTIIMTNPEEAHTQSPLPEYGITEFETIMFEGNRNGQDDPTLVITPEEAQRELERLGYDSTLWEKIVAEKKGSHDTRIYAIVALGNSPLLPT